MAALAARPILTLPQLAQFSGGDLVVREVPASPPEREAFLRSGIDGVTIDTRSLGPGQLFVPLRGANADGHDFLETAFQRGAAAAFCARDRWKAMEGREPGPLVVVEDVTLALQRLAGRYRQEWRGLLIGVTGSVGKTTTKDLVAAVLGSAAPTLATEGNFNNFWGVPLTLMRLRPEHQAAVVEMGMSEPGEIAHLATIAGPTAAVLTNAGRAHLEQLGSVEAIAREKASLAMALGPGDVAFVGADSPPLVAAMKGARCRVVTYGLARGAEVRPVRVTATPEGASRVEVAGFPPFTLSLPGRHMVANALAAVAVAREFRVDPARAAAAIESYRPAKGRMEVKRARGAVLLVDCYNANPDSSRAALETLAGWPGATRRLAAMGDMLELGENAAELHRETGAAAAGSELWAVGRFAEDWVAGAKLAKSKARAFEDLATMREELHAVLAAGVVVLIKASRGAALERLLEGLEMES